MSVELQEMDNVVSKGAKPADPMQTLQNDGSQLGSIEDLGGPTLKTIDLMMIPPNSRILAHL